MARVLIESDWNLKNAASTIPLRPFHVLIESDWNLKPNGIRPVEQDAGINRIRLEFKGKSSSFASDTTSLY